eukprot:2435200-Pyramimonas_sp.AAC.1
MLKEPSLCTAPVPLESSAGLSNNKLVSFYENDSSRDGYEFAVALMRSKVCQPFRGEESLAPPLLFAGTAHSAHLEVWTWLQQ